VPNNSAATSLEVRLLTLEYMTNIVEDHPKQNIGQDCRRGEDVLQCHLIPAADSNRTMAIKDGSLNQRRIARHSNANTGLTATA